MRLQQTFLNLKTRQSNSPGVRAESLSFSERLVAFYCRLALLVVIPLAVPAGAAPAGMVTRAEVQASIASQLNPVSEQPSRENLDWDKLQGFYSSIGNGPAWIVEGGVLSAAGLYLLNTFQHADEDAIDTAKLPLQSLQQIRALMAPNAQDLARLDLLLSDSALRYLAEWRGSLIPVRITPDASPVSTPEAGLLAAYQTQQVEDFIASTQLAHAAYRRLKTALATYKDIAARGGWPEIPAGPVVGRGSVGVQVPVLRRHLTLVGDYAGVAPVGAKKSRYFEPALVTALKQFQQRHGLRVSGKLDAASRAALNVPVEKRLAQLRANMARWRELPRQLGKRYILVNVVTYRVEVVENGEPRLTLKAIVGRPDRPTPTLVSDVSSIVFNPTWNVPTKLASEDLAPKQQKDPTFFTRQKIHVFSGWGRKAVEIQPTKINWSQIDAINFPYKLKQDPGPENSLGHIKFSFPNTYDVYLHDTPKRSLFSRSVRALSSGCVRVERPVSLAAYLLSGEYGDRWNEQRIKDTIAVGKRKTVRLKNPIRIYLVYWSGWVDDAGLVNFRDDIYDLDSGSKPCQDGGCFTANRSAG